MVRAAAVGSLAFVENVESELGSKAMHRDIVTANEIVDLTSSL
jgi:hypothetical protein